MVTRLRGETATTSANAPMVIKLGGRALEDSDGIQEFAADLAALNRPVVLVHGGGAEVNAWCSKLNIDSRFHDGLRVTDESVMEVATAVLTGLVNSRLVAGLLTGGVEAVGLSGIDGRTLTAEPHPDAARLGHVGRVASVQTGLVTHLLAAGLVPVISTIGLDRAGGTWNINADDAAAAMAVALGAGTILFLSDVPAVLVEGEAVGSINLDEAQRLLAHPDITGGMKPKLAAACRAVESGVGQAVISTWSTTGDLARLVADDAPARPAGPAETDLFAAVYPLPRLELSRGSGCRVVDAAGNAYLDFVSGIAVNALGHADPGLRAAVSRQMAQLVHVSNLFGNRPAIELAERLLHRTGYDRVFLCNSGGEANEAALKFARLHARAAGKKDGVIIAFEGAFHGRTAFALSATATPAYREPFEPLVPGIRFAPFNDAAAFDAIVAEEAAAGRPLSAVLIEPVQGEAGARVADATFLHHLRRRTTELNALLLFDEVQCGVGRSGKFLAAEHAAVSADITILAKGLGGGIPIGAILIRAELAALLEAGQHGTTFGGNPVAAAAASYVLDTIGGPGFMDNINECAAYLAAGLSQLVARFDALTEARGLGLLQAFEISESAGFDSAALIAACREEGLLLCKGGGRSVRVLPPLNVTVAELDVFFARLGRALGRLSPISKSPEFLESLGGLQS